MWADSSFFTKAVLFEFAQWDLCRCISFFSRVHKSAVTRLDHLAVFAKSASAEGLLLVAGLPLLHSFLRREGRYSAAIVSVFSGGAALTELRAGGCYKRFCLECVRGASQGCYERVSLNISQG